MQLSFYFILRRWVLVDVLRWWIIKFNWFAGLWKLNKTNAKYFVNIQTGIHYTTQWKQYSRLMLGLGSLKKKRAMLQVFKLPSVLFLHSTQHQYMVSWLTFTLIFNKAYSAFFKMKSITVTEWVRSKLKLNFNFELTSNPFMISYSFLLDSAIY